MIGGIQRHGPWIGHFHVAGLPKDANILPRGEMNVGDQLVEWKNVGLAMRSNASEAWCGIEYIPTEGRDYVADLAAAIKMLRG